MSSSVASDNLATARRLAKRAKIFQDCVACIAYGNRCSEIRPCSSCAKRSRSCIRVTDVVTTQWGQENQDIEHPLTFSSVLKLDRPPRQMHCRCKFGWAQEHLTSFLNMGCQVEHLAMAFDSFVLSDIDPVLRSIEKISLRASLAGCTVSSSLDFESHEQFWDVNTDTAFFSVKLDPNTR